MTPVAGLGANGPAKAFVMETPWYQICKVLICVVMEPGPGPAVSLIAPRTSCVPESSTGKGEEDTDSVMLWACATKFELKKNSKSGNARETN